MFANIIKEMDKWRWMKKSMVIGLCGAHFVFSIYVGAKELLLNLETSATWVSSDVQHVQYPSNNHLQQDTSKKEQRTNTKCLVVK